MADENLQMKPGLAVSWKPVDETTWEFKIREGVKFHDGSELTAEDVKFSIDRIPVVTGPMSMTIYTKQVKETEVKDKYTLHVKTKVAAPTLPNDFIRLFVVSKSIGADARNEQFNSGKAAIGTGPYKFVSWEPKGDFVVERFDGYWGDKQPWQKVVRKEIPNDPARMAALKSGQVDLVNYVPATDYASMQKDKNVDTFVADSVYFLNITPNVKETLPKPVKVDGKEIAANPLRDPKVREAMDLAIDRKTLVRVVLEGLGRPANQLMPTSFFGGSKIASRTSLRRRQGKAASGRCRLSEGIRDRLPLHQQSPSGRFGGVRGTLADVGTRRPQGERQRAQRNGVLPGATEGRIQPLDERLGNADR